MRTCPGLHAVARVRGLARSITAIKFSSAGRLRLYPGLRELALGYMLSPAYAGSRDYRGALLLLRSAYYVRLTTFDVRAYYVRRTTFGGS
jgi:hypothetical protein